MLTSELQDSINRAIEIAYESRHEYVTLAHLLYSLLQDPECSDILRKIGASTDSLKSVLQNRLSITFDDGLPAGQLPELSDSVQEALNRAISQASSSGKSQAHVTNLLIALFESDDPDIRYLARRFHISRLDLKNVIAHGITTGENKINWPNDTRRRRLTSASGTQQNFVYEEEAGRQTVPETILEQFTVELVEKARKGQIDPIVGREAEIERTMHVLCRRKKNNPMYVGESGVGKTAIAEGLALRISEGNVPEPLKNAKIYALNMGMIIAGTRYRGDFEERLTELIKEIKSQENAILFIDEIHTVVGTGAARGVTLDAANILKPVLANGEIRCIGATTFTEYKAAFETDKALARRFQKIEVREPTIDETVKILQGLKRFYETHHSVTYTDEALRAAAELAGKYINDRFLPDKAIDVIDEVGAAAKLAPKSNRPKRISAKMIEATVARMAKIPPKSVVSDEKEKLKTLDDDLRRVIYGQDEAISRVVEAIRVSRAGLGQPLRPIGVFLFSGPTGVGKTELARQIAETLGIEFIRFDMSEYSEPHTVSRLIGSPPGYVGFDQGGLLTEAILRTPHAVLVLDEIEKAHPNLFNLLLQVMDTATLTDNNGKKADFRNIILIMTTNAGARELSSGGVGFRNSSETKGNARGAIERTFNPEFLNRLDARIAFRPLDMPVIELIVDKFIGELNSQLKERNVKVNLTEEARRWLAEKGFDPRYGARPMSRLINEKIKRQLAEAILFGSLAKGGEVQVIAEDGDLKLQF
jgi:ATP-dependent Clp protease ATP-binding subunit ClpA